MNAGSEAVVVILAIGRRQCGMMSKMKIPTETSECLGHAHGGHRVRKNGTILEGRLEFLETVFVLLDLIIDI